MPALEYSKQSEEQFITKRLEGNTKNILKMKFKKMAAKMIENGYFPYQYEIIDKEQLLEDNKNHILIAAFKQEEWLFND